MPSVLTEGSTLKCVGEGSVQLVAGQSRLTVNGSKALVDGDLNGKTISGCQTPNTSGNKQCTVANQLPGGVALKLKVTGKGVLLETITGSTDGAPTPSWSVRTAGQTKLKAV